MSVYKKIGTNNGIFDNQSPLIILKNENNNLGDELNRINTLITKLKTQITKNEQEKTILISNNKKKERTLQEIIKTLEEANTQLTQLKNKELEQKTDNNNDLKALQEKNNTLKLEKEKNNAIIIELQKKITDLELQLKLSEKRIFTSLSEGKNESIEINKIMQNKEKDMFDGDINNLNSMSKNII
jgi:chromosome segregation ATPase